MQRDTFSSFHPFINLLYFACIIGCSIIFLHPITIGISLLFGILYTFYLYGRRAVRGICGMLLPMCLLAAILNPAFNHAGATILCYLPSGNPLTLESLYYGAASSAMLGAAVLWFFCFSAVMTTDKFVYLFGRAAPSLSLLLSMTLRFLPRFQAQFSAIRAAQHGINRDINDEKGIKRIRNAVTIFSIAVTWALEHAVETADAMKSRGYGLPHRSSFSIYRFDSRDKGMLAFLVYSIVMILIGAYRRCFYFRYYPTVKAADITVEFIFCQLLFLALCAIPLAVDLWEDRTWRHLRSNL
ncbi:MAG: energy-coupling factor transporter transmembrane protein EcfT [Clostridiales bacterium]|nr:energy-coupling factor transporter transmembrane protein EcfT [Clostridiales bacterium]